MLVKNPNNFASQHLELGITFCVLQQLQQKLGALTWPPSLCCSPLLRLSNTNTSLTSLILYYLLLASHLKESNLIYLHSGVQQSINEETGQYVSMYVSFSELCWMGDRNSIQPCKYYTPNILRL